MVANTSACGWKNYDKNRVLEGYSELPLLAEFAVLPVFREPTFERRKRTLMSSSVQVHRRGFAPSAVLEMLDHQLR